MPEETKMLSVSVIIPVLNGDAFIKPCIDYLVDQDYPEMEVIFVVDQKTTDDTLNTIKSNESRLPRIMTLIQTDNNRLGGARNDGVEKATGDIVWFLDVDDRPFPTFLKEMTRIMEDNSADVVFCNFYMSDKTDIPDLSKMNFKIETMDRRTALEKRCEEKLPVTAWSKIYTKKLIDENNLRYISGLAEDVDYTYRSLSVADKICYYNKPLYVYYQNQGSICNSNQNNTRGLREVQVYKELREYFKENMPEYYEYFVAKTTITSMRSMIHMDYPMFVKEYKGNWVREAVSKNGRASIEKFIFLICPVFYYYTARFVMNNFYYRNNTMYDNSMSTSLFNKLFNKLCKNI